MARHERDASEIRPSVSMIRLLVLGGSRGGLLRTLNARDAPVHRLTNMQRLAEQIAGLGVDLSGDWRRNRACTNVVASLARKGLQPRRSQRSMRSYAPDLQLFHDKTRNTPEVHLAGRPRQHPKMQMQSSRRRSWVVRWNGFAGTPKLGNGPRPVAGDGGIEIDHRHTRHEGVDSSAPRRCLCFVAGDMCPDE